MNAKRRATTCADANLLSFENPCSIFLISQNRILSIIYVSKCAKNNTWSNMYKHIIILEHGDSVMSSSMFFLVELYSLKHQARLTIEIPIENNWAVSMLFSWKSTLDQKNKST